MKILVFSDLHFFKDRLQVLESSCSWIAEQIQEHKPDMVVNCGDINHAHGYIDIEVLDALRKALDGIVMSLPSHASLWMVSGNHDQESKDAQTSIMRVLGKFPRITTVVGMPEIADGFGFAPYPPTTEELRKTYFSSLAKKLNKTSILFTHWEISGVPYRPNDVLKNTSHAVPTGGMQTNLIVNGHYHHPTTYKLKPEVVIVGSPCYFNYADTVGEVPRGALLLESARGGWTRTRLENPHGYLYDTIESERLADWIETNEHRFDRMKLRIKVKSAEDYDAISGIAADLRKSLASLKIIGDHKVAVNEFEAPMSLDSHSSLREYVSRKPSNIATTKLLEVGARLLEEARCNSRVSE